MKKTIFLATCVFLIALLFFGKEFLKNSLEEPEYKQTIKITPSHPTQQGEAPNDKAPDTQEEAQNQDPEEIPDMDSKGNSDENPNEKDPSTPDTNTQTEDSPTTSIDTPGPTQNNASELQNEENTYSPILEDIQEQVVIPQNYVESYRPIQYEPDRYEITAKEKEKTLSLDFKGSNETTAKVVINPLPLNDENIFFTLDTYTDYYENGSSLQNISYIFEVEDYEERYEDINTGEILISGEKIFVIMTKSQEDLEEFLVAFYKNNAQGETFLEYLQNNTTVLDSLNEKLAEQNEFIAESDAKVPQEIKTFGMGLWDAYRSLDIEALKKYYAEYVWIYADPNEWFATVQDENNYYEKKFFFLEQDMLLPKLKEMKTEEFSTDLGSNKHITFYYVEDLMTLCDGEDKDEFFEFLHIEDGDIVMFGLDGEERNICTVGGKFYFTDQNFWVLRNINGETKVISDFNE